MIDIDGSSYKAQRLIWACRYGEWPERTVDHPDCDQALTDAELAYWADKFRPDHIAAKSYKYYDPVRNWQRIEPHLHDPKIRSVLEDDFTQYTMELCNEEMDPSKWPRDYESLDLDAPNWWRWHKGRKPAYWKLVKHGACHWLVNTNLLLAQRVSPRRKWRILHSDAHSTVWDGDSTFFDLNFTALRIDPNETWTLATTDGRTLEPAEMLDNL